MKLKIVIISQLTIVFIHIRRISYFESSRTFFFSFVNLNFDFAWKSARS